MDEVWTVKQVAVYLKMSQGKVYRLAQCGALPAIKVGRTWRFRRHLIDSFLGGDTIKRTTNPFDTEDGKYGANQE